MTIGLDVAQDVAGLFVSAVLYGLYIPTVFFSLRCLLWDHTGRKSRQSVHWLTLIATLALWASATLNTAMGLLRSTRAFQQCEDPTAPVSDWVNVVKLFTTNVSTLTADGMLIYRCWAIWSKNYYVVMLPATLWFGNLGCVIVLTWMATQNGESDSLLMVEEMKPFFLANMSLVIPMNVITTALIIFRIWSIEREVTKLTFRIHHERSTLQNVMIAMVESGVLVTACAVLSFCTYQTDSNAFYIAAALQVPVVGIAFNLIIARAHAPPRLDLPTSVISLEEQRHASYDSANFALHSQQKGCN